MRLKIPALDQPPQQHRGLPVMWITHQGMSPAFPNLSSGLKTPQGNYDSSSIQA